MRKLFYAFIICLLATSCKKDESSKPSEVCQLNWVIINKEHQKIIENVSNDYEQSIIEALNERDSNVKSANDAYNISDRIYSKFNEKTSKYTAGISKSSSEPGMDPVVLQKYMVDLSDRLLNIEEFSDTVTVFTKEIMLPKFKSVLDKFNNSIMNSVSLTDVQKQNVIENAAIRFNIFYTTLKYGEEISGQSGSKGLFSWLRKQAAKIKCTAQSLLAGVACTAAVVSSPVPATGFALWAACVAQTMNAVACWAAI